MARPLITSRIRTRLRCLTLVAGSFLSVYAMADSEIEEIVVTAEFRDAGVDGLPASATVVAPDQAGTTIQHLEEILSRAPNVNLASGASRGRFIQVRGIGERGQFSDPLNPSIGLLLDGVDLTGVGTAATMFDVQQVEILRGPQGTLYGANALAGLINIVTPRPLAEHGGYVRLDAGDYGALGVGGVASGPLGDSTGYRLAAQSYRDDGFMENDFLGRDDTAERDEATLRAKLVHTGEHLGWQLIAGFVDVDNGYDAFSLDNERTTLSDEPGRDQQETMYAAFKLDYDWSARADFTGMITVADSDSDYGYDEDWTFTGFDPIGYTSTDRYRRDRSTSTVDLRWLSKPGQGLVNGVWDWVAGVYMLQQDVDFRRDYTFAAGPFDSAFEVRRLAAYGEVSRALTRSWRLSVGARVERHASEYDDSNGLDFDPQDNLFGARVLLEKELADGNLFYASLTQGYKAGGFNLDGSLAADLREYDPETLWNVELGYKAWLLDGRLSLRASLFRMQRDDIQISTSTTRPIDGSGAVEFISYTGNGAEGFNQGLEMELQFEATDNMTLFANIGVLDSEYENFVDNSGRDLDGREQAHAPGYQFFAGMEYRFNDQWALLLQAEGKDGFYFSDSHSARSTEYALFNASVNYEAQNWRLRLWGRNLSDEEYFVRGFFFGNDPRDFYTARPFTQLGEPRQVGLTVQMDF